MDEFDYKRKVALATATCFVMPFVAQVLSLLVYPPDFSGEFPKYAADGVLILQLGGAFAMCGLAIIGMKAEEEKQILAAAGFTIQAISIGLGAAGLFEILQVTTRESYEKFYYITVTSNFMYFPSLLLISTYKSFKRWIRIAGLVASFPMLVTTVMFLGKNSDYNTLESISNVGYFLLFVVWILWAYNVWINFKKEITPGKKTY